MSARASAEFVLVLRELGITAEADTGGVVVAEGAHHLQVVERAYPSVSEIEQLTQTTGSAARGGAMVVSDELGEACRRLLHAAGWGWLDRRGHLTVPALGLDLPIASLLGPNPAADDPWRRATVLTVATCLLQRSGPAPVTRDLGHYAGISASAASRALAHLRAVGAVGQDGQPHRQELFRQLAARWQPRWRTLSATPTLDELTEEARAVLDIGLETLDDPGWACLGRKAREVYGLTQAAMDGEHPRLLLPDRRALAWCLRLWGATDTDMHGTSVAVAPVNLASARRQPPSNEATWPLAHPLTLALDLASTSAGRRTLADWHPSAGVLPQRPW